MKFLSSVLLSLGTVRASFVVDLSHNQADAVEADSVPTEAPFPFPESSFATDTPSSSDRPSGVAPSTFPFSEFPSWINSSSDRPSGVAPSSFPFSEFPSWINSSSDTPSGVAPSTFPISIFPSYSDFPSWPNSLSDRPSGVAPSSFPFSEFPSWINSSSDTPSGVAPSTFPISIFPSYSDFPSGINTSGTRRPTATDSPTVDCTDVEGEFEYIKLKKKKEKVKTISCDTLSGFPLKRRNRFCRKFKEIRESCPTLCNRKICSCIDLEGPFPLSKRTRDDMVFFTCDKLAELSKTKQKELCKNKKAVRKSCPTICSKKCKASDE